MIWPSRPDHDISLMIWPGRPNHLQLARLTKKIERAFLAWLVKSSFWPYLAGDDDVELTAEKDWAFRRAARWCGVFQLSGRPPQRQTITDVNSRSNSAIKELCFRTDLSISNGDHISRRSHLILPKNRKRSAMPGRGDGKRNGSEERLLQKRMDQKGAGFSIYGPGVTV
ncbi:hypothetical protein Tco_0997858 [Tanacetum coccineum]